MWCGILAGTRTYTNIPAEGIPRKGHWMSLIGCVSGLETKWKALRALVIPTRLYTNIGISGKH